jgi:nucleotidyltransferase substrate binding protein (TIGR01987 family)
LKDFLEAGGLMISPVTPRQVIKEAFAAKVILNGEVWMRMLDHRNLLLHVYDELVFDQAVEAIAKDYLLALGEAHQFLKGRK